VRGVAALAALVVGSLPATGHAQEAALPAAALTLRQAQEFALAHHPEIQAAELRAQASGAAVQEARAAYLPQVMATATAAAADTNTRIAAPGGLNNPSVFQRESNGLLLSQLVTDFGRTTSLTASARYQADAANQTAEAVRARVLLDVSHAYFGVLGAKALLRVAEETVASRRLLLDRVSALAQAKLKSSLDVSFAEVALGESRLLLLRAQDDLQAADARLAAALGTKDASPRELADEPLFPVPPESVDELVRAALEARPELRAARARREAALRFASAEKAAQYPLVSAVGAVGFSPYRDDRLTSSYSAAGVIVSLPVFTGGRLSSRATQARLQAGAFEKTLDDAENRIERDVRIAWLAARTAHEAIDVTRATLESASRALELAQSRYDLGISSIVELSQAQLQKTQADIANASARYEYQSRRADLDFQVAARR
jgi:outer membrane protein